MNVRIIVRGGEPAGGPPQTADISIFAGATVNDVIHAYCLDSGEVWLGLVSGRLVDMEHELLDGDQLTLVPPVAGGC